MQITPSWVYTFERNLKSVIVDEWARVLPTLFWDRFMKLRPSDGEAELLEWMLTTAQIHPAGQGGNIRYDDIVSIGHTIENEDFGAGLLLTRNKIEDSKLDRAGQWATHVGSAGAYWPQEQLFKLIAAGKTEKAYDDVAFFSASHPVNPFNTGLGNYSNLIAAKPIHATGAGNVTLDVAANNLSDVISAVKTIKMPNGKFRKLRPTMLMGPPQLEKRLKELTGAQFFGQGGSGTTASADNVLRGYGFAPPTVAEELSGEATVWYVGCEDITSTEVGGFIFQERKPFALTSYQGDNQYQLDLRDEFAWHYKGRNRGAYGHPYLFIRVEPS